AAYERRHGWRGHLENILFEGQTLTSYQHPDWVEQLSPGGYTHGLVNSVSANAATIKIGSYTATLPRPDVAWTKVPLARLLSRGDVVYVKLLSIAPGGKARVSLEQDSGVQGALLAIDNASGEVRAMVGGRDFNL